MEQRLLTSRREFRDHLGGLGRAAFLSAAGPGAARKPTCRSSSSCPDLAVRESLRIKLPTLLAQEFPEVRGRVKLLPNGPPWPTPFSSA